MLQNVGWEGTFGGKLHGIFGWRSSTNDLPDAAQATFAKLIIGYDTAADAWEKAAAMTNNSTGMAMLIPQANAGDVMEAAGGPHFGPDGSQNPQYYTMNADGSINVQAVATLPAAPPSTYSLVPEQMNEAYWETYYGGASVPSEIIHPSSNENVYRNPNVMVDHYLASGGLVMTAASTRTARGFSAAEAYQYALNWISSNGGLPSDAALTFAGEETVAPTMTTATSDQPYPANVSYAFIWRHAQSSILGNDKIQINVDDAGALTETAKESTIIVDGVPVVKVLIEHVPPWIPVYHINTYVRIWRTLGTATAAYAAGTALPAGTYAYCATDMASTTSQAVPCGVSPAASATQYNDPLSGAVENLSEPL